MSQHYLVKLEIIIAHVLPLSVKERNSGIYRYPTLALASIFARLKSVDYSMWVLLQKKMYKTRITDLDELKQRMSTEWTKLDHIVIAATLSVVSLTIPDQ